MRAQFPTYTIAVNLALPWKLSLVHSRTNSTKIQFHRLLLNNRFTIYSIS